MIITGPKPPAIKSQPKPVATKPAQPAPTKELKTGWSPGAKVKGVVAEKASKPKVPQLATETADFVKANISASKKLNMMDMVAGSRDITVAAQKLYTKVAEELAWQIEDRGDAKGAAAVRQEAADFIKGLKAPQNYHLDPKRGTMGALEDNGNRTSDILKAMGHLASRLEKVNRLPAGDYQQAYNSNARGSSVAAEARLAIAFNKAFTGDDAALEAKSLKFFKDLSTNVDRQIESRGGSMEPMERGELLTDALKKFTAELSKKK